MFSGIIQTIGKLVTITEFDDDLRFTITTPVPAFQKKQLKRGDSISVNGVCLTAVELLDNGFSVDISKETLKCTNLGESKIGSHLNLENALTLAEKLNGHIVSGHVDEVGKILNITTEGRSTQLNISFSNALAPYIAKKGSICVNGISLTINHVEKNIFSVNIIPHTFQATNLKFLRPNDRVNLEVDLIARYLEKLLPLKY